MKILKTYKKLAIVIFKLHVTSADDGQKSARLNRTSKLFWALVCVCGALISSIIYLICYAKTFRIISETFFPFGALFVALAGGFFQISFSGASTFKLIDRIEDLIEKRMVESDRVIYVESDKFVEKWSGIVCFIATKTVVPCLMLPYVGVSYYLYCNTDLGKDAFYLPFEFWYPFDCKTPIGYICAVALLSPCMFFCPIMVLCDLFLAFGACYHLAAFTDDIKAEIKEFDQQTKIDGYQTQFTGTFRKIVEFHSTTKQFVFDHSQNQKLTLFMYFAWTMTTICDILLLVHIELHNNAYVTLIKPIYLLIWMILMLFVLCETAGNVTNKFIEISMYEECDWYTLPIDVQHKMIIFTANAQRPALIAAFGNIECTRETFKRVIKSAFSYFMLLRQFLD